MLGAAALSAAETGTAPDGDSLNCITATYGKDSTDSIYGEIEGVKDVSALNEWFDKEFLQLVREYYKKETGYRVIPLASCRTVRPRSSTNMVRWNIGAEYHMPLNTMNGSFAVFSQDFGKVQLFGKLFYGAGMGNIIGLDSADNEVSGNYGINGELAVRTDSYLFTPLFGLTYVWVDPENGSDGQGNYLYAGNRFFFTKARALSFDARVGTAFWRGMDDNQPPDWFVSGGITLHRDVDLTKIGKPLLAPVEVGLFGDISLETISSKVLVPFRLRKGLSLAPFALYGIETGSNDYSAVYGLGAELRLFGDIPDRSLNPYIGFQQNWLHDFPGDGEGSSAYFGARLYLNDIIAIDGNFGPVFWKETTQEDKDLKDWIGRVGITVAFGKIRETRDLKGSVMVRHGGWGANRIDENKLEHLEQRDVDEYDGEIRLFALEEPDTTCVCPINKREGDLTDLKFFTTGFDLELVMDPFNRKFNLLDHKEKTDEDVFIAVLFNKHNTMVDRLNEKNTFFHFFDLITCQYFGYRWDANHSRQPDYRGYDPALGATELCDSSDALHDQPFLGNWSEFVRPMQWLDRETLLEFIKGAAIEDRLLKFFEEDRLGPNWKNAEAPTPEQLTEYVQKNYRIGYVKYPMETLKKMKACRLSCDLASAVLVATDIDGDGLWVTAGKANWATTNPKPAALDDSVVVLFDRADDFYFSNHVRVEGLFSEDVVIDSFPECGFDIPDFAILDTLVIPYLRQHPEQHVSIYGYADGTGMSRECQEKDSSRYEGDNQDLLSEDRANAVMTYLTAAGIPADRIDVVGAGVKMPYRLYEPRDRCVILRFSL